MVYVKKRPYGARLDQLDGAIESALPGLAGKTIEDSKCGDATAGMILADGEQARGANSLIVRGGAARAVCQMVFLGYSNRAIGDRLKFDHPVVDRFVKSDYFRALMVEVDTEMRVRLDEHIFTVLENEALGLLQEMIEDARRKTLSARLRHRIRMDLLSMWERLADARKGGIGSKGDGSRTNVLTEVHERIAKLDAQGKKRTLIERITTTSPAASGAPPAEAPGLPTSDADAAGGGVGDGPLGESGSPTGAERAGETPGGDGSAGLVGE